MKGVDTVACIPREYFIGGRSIKTEIPFMAPAAILCGPNSCVGFAEFGRGKERLLRQFLESAHSLTQQHATMRPA